MFLTGNRKLKLWRFLIAMGFIVYFLLQGAAGFAPIVLFSLVPIVFGLLGLLKQRRKEKEGETNAHKK